MTRIENLLDIFHLGGHIPCRTGKFVFIPSSESFCEKKHTNPHDRRGDRRKDRDRRDKGWILHQTQTRLESPRLFRLQPSQISMRELKFTSCEGSGDRSDLNSKLTIDRKSPVNFLAYYILTHEKLSGLSRQSRW